ncbi:hypothetical protein RIF29_08984 [Crotalaria pallida]|uniref:Endonuclease/exonuclease/phosphatase domain-containing protein n=1 Tax=Crotalaria pallida TaxID=3830 RepID=A0AAN9FZ53_CROPI
MVKDLIRKYGVDFIGVQETKMEVVEDGLCSKLWGGESFDWAFRASQGRSGGILCIWNKDKFLKESVFQGEGFVAVQGVWYVGRMQCVVVIIYSPCNLTDKRKLWAEIYQLKCSSAIQFWCVMGDFNTIRDRAERRGSVLSVDTRGMRLFNSWIDEMELVDLPLIGRRFTYYQAGGVAMSRIDRIMVSNEWLSYWPSTSQWAIPREFSDHCPILLKYQKPASGPKPFRLNNCWFHHQDFKPMVRSCWERLEVQGWRAFVVKEKLKLLKAEIKKWNKEIFGCLELKLGDLNKKILDFDLLGEVQELTAGQLTDRKLTLADLWKTASLKENLIV